jgi:hypothetical protein
MVDNTSNIHYTIAPELEPELEPAPAPEPEPAPELDANITNLMNYTINNILNAIQKGSLSNTVVFKATRNLDNKKLYLKIGIIDNKPKNNIDYELDVYKRLHYQNVHDNEILKYFMDCDVEISGLYNVDQFLYNINVDKAIIKEDIHSKLKKITNNNDNNFKIVVIGTYDTGAISLYDYLENLNNKFIKEENKRNIFINLVTIMLLILNAIKILNTLQINHNDMHYENMLIKEEKIQYKVNIYDIESNILSSDVKIIIYDFDHAYLSPLHNKLLDDNLCNSGRGCNNYLTNRDYFFFVQQLCVIYYKYSNESNYTKLFAIVKEICENIIPNFNKHLDNYILIETIYPLNQIRKPVLWSASCINTVDINGVNIFNCDKKLNEKFDWVQEIPQKLYKYIIDLDNDKNNTNTLRIIKTPSTIVGEPNNINFEKKYLKYKLKYLCS